MADLDIRQAWALLKEYNREAFHLRHAQTVALCMRYFAETEGFAGEADFWEIAGLLHDLDFELYPEQHCVKCQEIMRERALDEKLIRAVASHGYGICTDIVPEHPMEKLLFASDELTGLIGAAALMRPSRSVQDMALSSLKKKYKDKRFAAGCSRAVIERGARLLGWELETLLSKTLEALRAVEDKINDENYYER
ncbi:MAG: hydrolase [Oscillospiraceae bacterium]|jgi:predicted hydrolase (HD superfamily)|nr:hydrolase [Oscillospiraceae bacterium]